MFTFEKKIPKNIWRRSLFWNLATQCTIVRSSSVALLFERDSFWRIIRAVAPSHSPNQSLNAMPHEHERPIRGRGDERDWGEISFIFDPSRDRYRSYSPIFSSNFAWEHVTESKVAFEALLCVLLQSSSTLRLSRQQIVREIGWDGFWGGLGLDKVNSRSSRYPLSTATYPFCLARWVSSHRPSAYKAKPVPLDHGSSAF